MTNVAKTCLHCGKEFKTTQKEVNRGSGLHCSHSCASKRHAKLRREKIGHNATCAYCSTQFYRTPSILRKASKSGLSFCSRKCKDMAQRLSGLTEMHPAQYGKTKDYRIIAYRHYEQRCNRCGYDKCKSCLEVHHKDRNRENNSLDNLEVLCRNCHGEEHYYEVTMN